MADTTWYQNTGAHVKRHKWKYGLGLGAAVLAGGLTYFMWQARNAPVETRETVAVTSTAVAGQGYGRRPTQMRAATETAVENASTETTQTTGTAYDATTTMQTTTMAMAPNVNADQATTGGIESIVEKGIVVDYSSDENFAKQFGFEKKYVDPATHPDTCKVGPYISVMQRADIEDSVAGEQLATTTASVTDMSATPAATGAAPMTTSSMTTITTPATQTVGYTYTIGDKEFTFKTPSQYLSPGTIVFHDGDKAFYTPVATMQQGEKGTPMYTSLDQIMDAQRANVTRRGVFATPFDAELKSNIAGVYTTGIGSGQSVEFTSHDGNVRLSKRFNTPAVYRIVGDSIVTADELKQLDAKNLLVVYEIDRGDQSVLTGGMFTYVDPAAAGTLPMITSSKAPVYETIKAQRSMAAGQAAEQSTASQSASYQRASSAVETSATRTDATSTTVTSTARSETAPQTIEQRVKPSAPTIVGNVVGDVIVNGGDAQRFNIISPRDAYGWKMDMERQSTPIITQESFDNVAKGMYPRAPSVPAGVYKGN